MRPTLFIAIVCFVLTHAALADASPVIAGNQNSTGAGEPYRLPITHPWAIERDQQSHTAPVETSRASIATPAIEDRPPAPVGTAGEPARASFVDCGPLGCAAGGVRRVAAAPVRFLANRQPLRRAWANRPRLLPRFRR